jgi:hypothetical protein
LTIVISFAPLGQRIKNNSQLIFPSNEIEITLPSNLHRKMKMNVEIFSTCSMDFSAFHRHKTGEPLPV